MQSLQERHGGASLRGARTSASHGTPPNGSMQLQDRHRAEHTAAQSAGAATLTEEAVTRSESIYNSPRLAAGYAYDRPAIHERIIDAAREHLPITNRLGRALDVGCGAGLSTAALESLAETVIGLEPVHAMLAHSRVVAPRAVSSSAGPRGCPSLPGRST